MLRKYCLLICSIACSTTLLHAVDEVALTRWAAVSAGRCIAYPIVGAVAGGIAGAGAGSCLGFIGGAGMGAASGFDMAQRSQNGASTFGITSLLGAFAGAGFGGLYGSVVGGNYGLKGGALVGLVYAVKTSCADFSMIAE